MLDMEALISKERLMVPLLKDVDIGVGVAFNYDGDLKRLSFFQSITNALIFPLLHSNVNVFLGFYNENKYLCYKVIGDKFIALKPNGEL